MGSQLVSVTPTNVLKETLFCNKDAKSSGFKTKQNWMDQLSPKDLRFKILKDEKNKSIGFIEYLPGELAWRPVHAPNYLFIHCMYVTSKKDRGEGNGAH